MRRTTILALSLVLLTGCRTGDPDSAAALEKRLEGGDLTVVAELETEAPGNPWAALALGRAYHLALGTEADFGLAMYHYAMAQKLPAAWFNAGLLYSQMLIDGLLPEVASAEPDNACFRPSAKSPTMKAIDCFTRAAEEARPVQARLALGRLFQEGQQDLAPNPGKACLWFSRAAEEHDDEGRFQYGMCLLTGNGVPRNVRAGTHMLLEAAKHYHAGAIRQLATLFRDAEDKSRAAFWMLLLAEAEPSSRAEVARFMARIPASDKARAKSQFDIWLRAHRIPAHASTTLLMSLPVSVADMRD
jgi:TPR repeat protein